MQIGELAHRTGISTKALRYYEEIGILDPPPRTHGGYRDYPLEVVDRLRFVKAAQAAGLRLGEIRGVIALRHKGETPCAHVLDLIASRRAEIDARIAELERMRRELTALERRGRRLDSRRCSEVQVCHVIAPKRIEGSGVA